MEIGSQFCEDAVENCTRVIFSDLSGDTAPDVDDNWEDMEVDDDTDRLAVENFVRVGRKMGAHGSVHEEVDGIMADVDGSKRFSRKVKDIQWHEGYYVARDNYHGKFVEGGDPSVYFNPREKLERFVTTKTDHVTVRMLNKHDKYICNS